jgi:hypothetical protein
VAGRCFAPLMTYAIALKVNQMFVLFATYLAVVFGLGSYAAWIAVGYARLRRRTERMAGFRSADVASVTASRKEVA